MYIMETSTRLRISEWEFVFNGSSEEYPAGYYFHKPTETKYSFERGITDIVGSKIEQDIYDTWWMSN